MLRPRYTATSGYRRCGVSARGFGGSVIGTPGIFTGSVEAARAVADAVLYEGYLLYPYRLSSGKNQVRWQFGVLAPPAWVRAQGPPDDGVAGSAESWWQQTECLVEAGDEASVTVVLRFLHVQRRSLVDPAGGGGVFDEAVPCAVDLTATLAELRSGPRRQDIAIPGGEIVEPALGDAGTTVHLVRRRRPLAATMTVSIEECPAAQPVLRLRVRVENTDRSTGSDEPRNEALTRCLLATHTLVSVDAGRFHSLLDPPDWAAAAARGCRNVRTFPVLAGPEGTADALLSSPIILYDHPRVAPESPGDLHDATEIDEILSLRTLTLTDAEKREARATDPRAAAIADRVDAMPPEVLDRLHGAIRSLRPAAPGPAPSKPAPPAPALGTPAAEKPVPRRPARARPAVGRPVPEKPAPGRPAPGRPAPEKPVPDRPAAQEQAEPPERWWEPGADDKVSPATDSVVVAGVRVAVGSRVRLRPRLGGADPHDMFLAGRSARVEQVLLDVDGSRFLAVTVDDDPGAELHHWYGRLRHFRPDEVEPLAAGTAGSA
ncbi:hypothetical protein ACFQ1L_19025 [Phytohabitans flavus]